MPDGCGAVLSFDIKGGKAAGVKFIDSLKLLCNVANLGDSKSLVSHPASTTHSQLSEEQLAAVGISSGTIRLSIGLESVLDILKDLENALEISQR
jgi:O-acetylhomoserine (thiol)-lyase